MAPVTKAKIAKVKLGNFVTPAGSALFVSCPNASMYNEDKQEASVVVSPDEWEELKAQIDKAIKECDGYSLVPKDKMEYPVSDDVDTDKNPTGNIRIKSKTAMQYPAKLLDSKGKPIVVTPGFSIPNRSKIRLAVGAEVISTAKYKGVILRLNAVKVISASPFGGSNPFSGYDDEGDYESPTTNAMDSDETMDWVD